MSIVAIVLFPIVLVYQGWNYYTFRHRIVGPAAASPEPEPGPTAPPATSPAAPAVDT